MLSKLLKYDFRYIYRVLGAYYLITITSILLGKLIGLVPHPPFIIEFISKFLVGAGFGLSIGLLINAITRTWVRFSQNLYGDESYLTHTLPVSRSALFASKFIGAIINLVFAFVTFIAAFLIAFGSELLPTGLDLFTIPTGIPNLSILPIFYVVLIVLLVFLQFLCIIQCGFFGIIAGHRHNARRGILSAVYGVAAYLTLEIILAIVLFVLSTVNPVIHEFLATSEITNIDLLFWTELGLSSVYLAFLGITYYLNLRLLKRGVNVE